MTSPEFHSPLHLFHCFIELGKLAIEEKKTALRNFIDDAQNVDFGDDE